MRFFEQLFSSLGTTTPTAPASGFLKIFGRTVSGRIMPAFVGPSGLDSSLQPFIARNKIAWWNPPGNATTVPGVLGFPALTVVGTATARNVAVTNLFTRMKRLGIVSATTAGSFAAGRFATAQYTVGDGTGLGGFHDVIRFGISDAVLEATARMFVGVSASTAAPKNVAPSTLVNSIGIGHDASETTLKLYYGGTTAQTPIDLGASFPVALNTAYELTLFSPPSVLRTIHYEVTNLSTGAKATGTLSGTAVQVPNNTVFLTAMQGWRCNNAALVAVALDICSIYIETDY